MKIENNLRLIPARNGKPGYYLTDITLKGRRVRRYAGQTKEDAKIFLGKMRIAARDGKLGDLIKPPKTGEMTFGEYARSLLDSAEWKAKRSSERNEISFKNLNQSFKNVPLAEIKSGQVRRYITERQEDGLQPATINREISFLKSVLYTAEYDGLIVSNPIRGRRIKKQPENNHREKIILSLGLTDQDLFRLVESAADYLQPILKLALTTGMRQGEILKAKRRDFDLTLQTIRVPEENAKSKKERIVPVDPCLCAEIDSLPRKGEYIFSNDERGSRIKDIRGAFEAACKAADIRTGRREGVVFHDLRHFAAYHLVKATDIVTASKILGHASLDMTLRYVHSTQADKRAAVEKVAEMLFSTRQNHVNAPNQGASKVVENRAQIN